MAKYNKPVVFKLEDEVFGVDINQVQSIERQLQTVSVPNAMPCIKGIINLRGEVVPVYSLKKKFGITAKVESESAIIMNMEGGKIALEVDEVLEINEIDEQLITHMPQLAKNKDTGYLDRVAHLEDRLIILLDIDQLLSQEETEVVDTIRQKMLN